MIMRLSFRIGCDIINLNNCAERMDPEGTEQTATKCVFRQINTHHGSEVRMSIFNSRGRKGSIGLHELAVLIFLPFIILYWLFRIVVWLVRKLN